MSKKHECQDWNTYVSISPHDRLMISTVKDFGSWAAETAVASLWFRQAGEKKYMEQRLVHSHSLFTGVGDPGYKSARILNFAVMYLATRFIRFWRYLKRSDSLQSSLIETLLNLFYIYIYIVELQRV